MFRSKLDEKEVLHFFLPLFVEKSYFSLATILVLCHTPPPPTLAPPPFYFLGGEVVYRPVYIAVLTFWRPSWTPS